MKKKGQVTLFVIIGFLIMISLSLAYYALTIKGKIVTEQSKEIPPTKEILPAKYLVERCLSLIAQQGITLLGKRGGYIEQPFPRLEMRLTEKENLAYLYLRRSKDTGPKITIPTIYYMEKEIERYIKNYLRYCLDDFEFFSHTGVEIKMQKMTVNATIGDKAVAVFLYFPVTLKTGNSVVELKDFVTTIPVKLGYIHKLATDIVEATKTFEESLRKEIKSKIKSKINACDTNPKIETKLPIDELSSRYPKLRISRYESDCQQNTGFCDVWTLKVTVQYRELVSCTTKTTEVQQLAPLTTVYGILDDEAPQSPFIFLFMTKINIDEEGSCNYNC